MSSFSSGSHRSLGRRVLLGAVLLWLILLGIVLPLSGSLEREQVLLAFESRLQDRAAAIEADVLVEMRERAGDVRFLSATPPIAGIARAVAAGGYDAQEQSSLALWRRRLETIFSAYLAAHPESYQVRYLGVAERGKDIVRVERREGRLQVASNDLLRDNASRSYFQELAQLEARQVYFSPLARKDTQQPASPPTLRVGVPVFGEDEQLFGMVIVNRDAAGLLSDMQVAEGMQLIVTNDSGGYLRHPEPARAFAFERGEASAWQDEYQPVKPGTTAGRLSAFDGPNGRVHALIREVYYAPNAPERHLRLIFLLPQRLVQERVAARQWQVLRWMLVGGGVIAAFLVLIVIAYRRHEQVGAQQAELAAIVSGSSDAIIGMTLDGQVTSWNPGAQRLFGYRASEAVGQSVADLISSADGKEGEQTLWQRVASGEKIPAFDTRRRHRDGRLLDVSISMSPVVGPDGRVIGASKLMRDIRRRKAAQAKIEELNATLERRVAERTAEVESLSERLRLATDAAGMGVWDWDIPRNELVWDERMRQLYGLSRDQAVTYEAWRDRIVPEDRDATEAKLQAAQAGGPQFNTEFRITLPDGGMRHINGQAVVLRDARGQPMRIVGVNRDVTREHQNRAALERARDVAEQASRSKSLFVANMSHELRAPMHAILGFAGVGNDNAANLSVADHQEIYSDIRDSADRLLLLINDLLDLSKLEAGGDQLEVGAEDMADLAAAARGELRTLMADKGIECRLQAAEDCRVDCDRRKILQVLINILSNAIRFSPEGASIDIEIMRARSGLQLRVRDAGPGIPPDECELIFESFQQSSTTQTGAGGTGLGLAICREIVRAHGGSIWAGNNATGGAVVGFELPFKQGEDS